MPRICITCVVIVETLARHLLVNYKPEFPPLGMCYQEIYVLNTWLVKYEYAQATELQPWTCNSLKKCHFVLICFDMVCDPMNGLNISKRKQTH